MGEPIATVGELAGVCGHDGTSWEKILIDSSKRLVVAIASIVATDAQMHGHIGGAWQKQPLVWGYSDAVAERVVNTNADAGINTLDTTAVPSGEVHYITSVFATDATSAITVTLLSLRRSSVNYNFRRVASPGAGDSVENANPVILKEGDVIRATFQGCTAGDSISLMVSGYRMDIDL